MYRRPKFLEILDEVRQEMSREADYDVDLFAELLRNENNTKKYQVEDSQSVITLRTLSIEETSEKTAPKTKR